MRDDTGVCDTITSLSINGQPDSTGVTTFLQEACESVDVLGKFHVPSKVVAPQTEFQDLKEYFRRPRMIGNGVLPTATRSRNFATVVTTDVLFSSYFVNGYSRLAGVDGVRFRLVYTLQIAATPFHQGILALNWQYAFAGSASYRSETSQSSTALPHVRLDLSVDTMVQLAIPFVAPYEYLDLSVGTTAFGTIALNTIAAIPTVASISAPSYKLYVHLEELELCGANAQATTTVALQAGRKLKPIDEEQEDEAYPMSSALVSASKTFKWIAKGIPALSSLAGPPAWVLGKAAGVARYFGYSKPQIMDPIVRVVKAGSAAEANTDLASATVVVGPMASNNLKVDPTFSGTDVDEMSLSYVLGQYSQINYGAITTSNTASQVIYASYVSPSAYWFRAGSSAPYCNVTAPVIAQNATTNAFYPSNLFFFSSMFRYWKGGVKFRFTFSKTKFHGGRVMAAFIPYRTLVSDGPSDAYGIAPAPEALGGNTQPFGYSAVFDLRDGNVFEFEVPYVNSVPYVSFFKNIGSVTLSIIDPLQAPTTVSSSINFIVEVKAMSDFELAVPVGPRYPGVQVNNPATVRLQSGRMLSTISANTDELCVGEHINSVKQLIMMPKWSSCGNIAASEVRSTVLAPWFYHRNQLLGTPAPVVPWPSETLSMAANIALCYAYVRGGTDYHVYCTGGPGDVMACVSHARGDANNNVGLLWTPSNTPGASLPRVYTSSLAEGLHVRLPAYQRVVRYFADVVNGTAWSPTFGNAEADAAFPMTDVSPLVVGRLTVTNPSATGRTVILARCAADDAMLGQYIGPPFLGLLSGGSGTSYDVDTNTFF